MTTEARYYQQDYGTPNTEQVNLLQTRKAAAFDLPHPDEQATFGELVESLGRSTVRTFSAAGILHRGDPIEADDETGHWWSTDSDCYCWLIDNFVPPEVTPCECSTGIRTVEAGEVYTCLNDDCDERFGRERALEVVSADE